MGYLYKLDFASGKSYIGMTTQRSVKARMRLHRCVTIKGSKLAVHRAWRKYGEPAVTTLAIASGAFLLELEQRAVLVYQTFGRGGYNMTPGGDVSPSTTPEARAKLSVIAKARIFTTETREKMSASGKTRIFTEEHRANIAKGKTGSKHSPQTMAKLVGRVRSAEHKANISAAKKGKPGHKLSPETIAKLTGRVFSAEHRARISAALKEYHDHG